MEKSNDVKTIKVYCQRCGYEDEYSKPPPHKCPKCHWHKLSLEKDAAWNPLCWQWAIANGYSPSARCSLTQWFFLTGKSKGWAEFKRAIEDHETIGPPPPSANSNQAIDFWMVKTGLKALLIKALNTVPINLGMASDEDAENFLTKDPKVRALMSDYCSYWKRKRIIN